MKKCLLWGTGKIFYENINLIKFHEMVNHFEVIGVTSNTSIYSKVGGYNYISKNNLKNIDFDIVIIMAEGKSFKEICFEAMNLKITEERIFTYKILIHQTFDVDKYIKLKKNPPSIFSNNCWGGLTYHRLGLKFTSPLINMFEIETDYLKLLKNPKRYMSEKLELIETKYSEKLKINYPIVKCGDIALHFSHYDSFENANACWERRKQRINWDNLFVMMYTEDYEIANEFTKLPYKKKICFVPFCSDKDSLIFVEFRNKNEMANTPLWNIVNGMAQGYYPYYNVFDLIENCKITKIVETI